MKLLAATVMSLFLLASASIHTNQARAASGSGTPPFASSYHPLALHLAKSLEILSLVRGIEISRILKH